MVMQAPPADLVEEWFMQLYKCLSHEAKLEVIRELVEIYFLEVNFENVVKK